MHTVTAHISRRCRPFVASAVLVPALALMSQAATASGREVGCRVHPDSHHRPSRRGSRLVRMAGQALQPPAPGPRVPERPTPQRRRRTRASISASTSRLLTAPRSTRSRPERSSSLAAAAQSRVKGATRTFGYWHIVPAVRNRAAGSPPPTARTRAARRRPRPSRRARRGRLLNPLRPGGIGPYIDRTPPTVASVEFLRNGPTDRPRRPEGPLRHHRRGLRHDPMLVPDPGRTAGDAGTDPLERRLTAHAPSFLRRRRSDSSRQLRARSVYDSVYAAGYRQNRAAVPATTVSISHTARRLAASGRSVSR